MLMIVWNHYYYCQLYLLCYGSPLLNLPFPRYFLFHSHGGSPHTPQFALVQLISFFLWCFFGAWPIRSTVITNTFSHFLIHGWTTNRNQKNQLFLKLCNTSAKVGVVEVWKTHTFVFGSTVITLTTMSYITDGGNEKSRKDISPNSDKRYATFVMKTFDSWFRRTAMQSAGWPMMTVFDHVWPKFFFSSFS